MAAIDDPTTLGRARLSFADHHDIDEFIATLDKFERGEIGPDEWRAFRLVRGTYGQRQDGDVHMLRVKVPQGVLDPRQLYALATVAETYSRGFGHITTRQNIQFHFVKLHDVELAMQLLADVGVTTREACGNSVRNITCCPYAGVAKNESFDVTPFAEALTRYLLRHPSHPRIMAVVPLVHARWCLKDGADTCARGVTVAAFFNRPRAVDDADDHVGGGRDAFFSDDELELPTTGGSQPRQQSLLRNDVLHKIDVSIEVESELAGTGLTHRGDRRQISVLATAYQRHRRAVPRRFRHLQLDIHRRDHLEGLRCIARPVRCDKEERKIRSVPPRVLDQPLDQHPRMTAVVARWVGAHRANSADTHTLPIDGPREVVSLRAGQQVSPLH